MSHLFHTAVITGRAFGAREAGRRQRPQRHSTDFSGKLTEDVTARQIAVQPQDVAVASQRIAGQATGSR